MEERQRRRSGRSHGRICAAPPRNCNAAQCKAMAPTFPRRRRYTFQPTTVAGFLALFFAAVLEAPYLFTTKTAGNGVSAALCDTADASSATFGIPQDVVVTPINTVATTGDDAVNLTTIFNCEDGDFRVSWSGVINISSTITIGKGTTVSIVGDTTNVARGGTSSAAVGQRQQHYATGLLTKSNDLDAFGSIFYIDGGQLFLERMSIRDGVSDSTTNTSSIGGGGGGVRAISSNITVVGCKFENNFAYSSGGGVHVRGSTLQMMDTIFRGNQAGFETLAGEEDLVGAGGGIWAHSTDMFIDGCTFEYNFAGVEGGGVHQDQGHVYVNNSNFFNNTAGSHNAKDKVPHGEGGGIVFTACNTTVEGLGACGVHNTKFTRNKASDRGGAVSISKEGDGSYIEFQSCVLDGNTAGEAIPFDAQGEGGAFSVAAESHLAVDDCLVTKNTAGIRAGAVYMMWAITNGTGAGVVLRNSVLSLNTAETNTAGAILVGRLGMVYIAGGNVFRRNQSQRDGGVISGTQGSTIIVEGGQFSENNSEQSGAVFSVRLCTLRILGGTFFNNSANVGGGVIHAGATSVVAVEDGIFKNNEALNGGVIYLEDYGASLIQGGLFSGNVAHSGGGAVFVGEDAAIEVTGGDFADNIADFGGFIYKEGAGNTSCKGASVLRNRGVDGGAIYAIDGANLDWECDLIGSHALEGAAVYARAGTTVTFRNISLSDNRADQGSIVFVLSSNLKTYQVMFNNTAGPPDLSAVYLDAESSYMAEDTSFHGFDGEVVIESNGVLYLDDCDFSGSWSSFLVRAKEESETVARNTVLGDNNYRGLATVASSNGELPAANSLMNVKYSCTGESSGVPPCSNNSVCLEGDVGVYCQCYIRNSTYEEKCLEGPNDALSLTVGISPDPTYFPSLVEGDVVLSLGATTPTSSMTNDGSEVGCTGGVLWDVSSLPSEFMDWTVFPSTGLLLPGTSMSLRVVTNPNELFDGNAAVSFVADGLGCSSTDDEDTRSRGGATVDMNITYYHCTRGNIWNISRAANETSDGCLLCTDVVEGNIEGADCSHPGMSITTLPIKSGYWRASLEALVIHKCFNEEACNGGSDVSNEHGYCNDGYNGPYCAVCSAGYGNGAGHACHRCTDDFKAGMYVVLTLMAVCTIIVAALLAVYLVGGRRALSSTMKSTRNSFRTLQRRGSGLFLSRSGKSVSSSDCDRSVDATATYSAAVDRRLTVKARTSSRVAPEYGINATTILQDKISAGPTSEIQTGFEGRASPFSNDKKPRNHSFSSSDEESILTPQTNGLRSVQPTGAAVDASQKKGSRRWGRGAGGNAEVVEKRRMTLAAKVGAILSNLPLSKLKIVIVVWQISTAFAEISQVSFPPVFQKFLSVIGVFTFDLGWIFSSTCLTSGIDFYDKLLIVTIGPLVLLFVLGITFFIGSRARITKESRRNTSRIYGWRLTSSSAPTAAKGLRVSVEGAEGTSVLAMDSNMEENAIIMESPPVSPAPKERGILRHQGSIRSVWKNGPGDDPGSDQNRLWWLFARHTTMLLVILYLGYSQVSTTVFQTFACNNLPEVGKRYLRADFSIECDTPKHRAYKIYAFFMILIYPLGIPAAFCYILFRQKSRINPSTEEVEVQDAAGEARVKRENLEQRSNDQGVAPTAFLWNAYYPNRYYYEVCECLRRLLLTGLLVFLAPDTSGQAAFSCVFAVISLLGFELLRPHMDHLERQLYRTGCLVIFFTNFLALMIKAEVADVNSGSSEAYSAALIAVNILLFSSVWWNTWTTTQATFRRGQAQNLMLGVDVVDEKHVDKFLRARYIPSFKSPRGSGEGKKEVEEASPGSESYPLVMEEGKENTYSTNDLGQNLSVNATPAPSTVFRDSDRIKFSGMCEAPTGGVAGIGEDAAALGVTDWSGSAESIAVGHPAGLVASPHFPAENAVLPDEGVNALLVMPLENSE